MKSSPIRVKTVGRTYIREIPPVEWVLEDWKGEFSVGKMIDGSLLVLEQYRETTPDRHSLVITIFKNFRELGNCYDYGNDFLRAVAHALGIEKLRWRNQWVSTDDYFRDPVVFDLPTTSTSG